MRFSETKRFEEMNEKYAVIRCDDDSYCVILNSEIERDGYLHNTYNNYGQLLGEYEAGDYCLANTETDFAIMLERELRWEFEVLEHATFYMSEDGIFDYDVEIAEDELSQINRYVQEYVRENTHYTKATYYTYWDGSNYQSIVFDSELDCGCHYEIIEDDDVVESIFESIDGIEEWHEYGTGRSAKVGKYTIRVSYYASNPFIYELIEE